MEMETAEIVRAITNDYLTTEQVMNILGVSKQTIYNWTSSRKLPCYKFGKTLKFHVRDIQAYIESTRQEAIT